MGIWFPEAVYEKAPILLPWVVRDPTCRGNRQKGLPDEWSAPNDAGYLRDDNSLVKAIPRNLAILAPQLPHLNNAKMGTDFVAAHIWRLTSDGQLASRNPLLNTFVPNMIWLPRQVAKLTDREGSLMQEILQSLAWQRYRHLNVDSYLVPTVEEAWSLIPKPTRNFAPTSEVNSFVVNENFFDTHRGRLRTLTEALEAIGRGEPLNQKVISKRYTEGLPRFRDVEREKLLVFLKSLTAGSR